MFRLGGAKEQLKTAPSSTLVPKSLTKWPQCFPISPQAWGSPGWLEQTQPQCPTQEWLFPDFPPLCVAGGCGRAVLNSPDLTQGCVVFISAPFFCPNPLNYGWLGLKCEPSQPTAPNVTFLGKILPSLPRILGLLSLNLGIVCSSCWFIPPLHEPSALVPAEINPQHTSGAQLEGSQRCGGQYWMPEVLRVGSG